MAKPETPAESVEAPPATEPSPAPLIVTPEAPKISVAKGKYKTVSTILHAGTPIPPGEVFTAAQLVEQFGADFDNFRNSGAIVLMEGTDD